MIPEVAQIWQGIRSAWESWGIATGLGTGTSSIVWIVWHFTKVPCLPDNAATGLCNPGWLARFINAEILVLAGGAGIAVATLKGGYDYYMLKNMINQEREARIKTEQELQEVKELIAELRNELHEERRQAAEARRQADEERRQAEAEERRLAAEERRQAIAIQQSMLDTIVRLAERRNGNGNASRTSD